jgi:hypothetical protein
VSIWLLAVWTWLHCLETWCDTCNILETFSLQCVCSCCWPECSRQKAEQIMVMFGYPWFATVMLQWSSSNHVVKGLIRFVSRFCLGCGGSFEKILPQPNWIQQARAEQIISNWIVWFILKPLWIIHHQNSSDLFYLEQHILLCNLLA